MRTLLVLLAILSTATVADASTKVLKLADKTTSDPAPFGPYTNFISPEGAPPLISFELFVGDDCVMTDAKGATFAIKSGHHQTFSKVYFPIRIEDKADQNNCDNMQFSKISLEIDETTAFSLANDFTVNQDLPFATSYLAGIAGGVLYARVEATFFDNFVDMKCLAVAVTDGTGASHPLTAQAPVFEGTITLPMAVSYKGTCLTSPLIEAQQENPAIDITVSTLFELP